MRLYTRLLAVAVIGLLLGMMQITTFEQIASVYAQDEVPNDADQAAQLFSALLARTRIDEFPDIWTPSAVRVDGSGSVHMAVEASGRGRSDIYYVVMDGENVRSVENVSMTAMPSSSPDLYIATSGDVWVVWQQRTPEGERIYYRQRTGGGWAAAASVEAQVGANAKQPHWIIDEGGFRTGIEWLTSQSDALFTVACQWPMTDCRTTPRTPDVPLPASDQPRASTADPRVVAFLYDGNVWLGRADGSTFPGGATFRRVTSAGNVNAFVWSPDGSQIAYMGEGASSYADVYVVNADGTNQRRLTTNALASRWVIDWNDTRIAFLRDVEPFPNVRIAVVDVNSAGVFYDVSPNIENWGVGFDILSYPDMRWSPDGNRIALFHGYASGVFGVGNGSRLDKSLFNPSWKHDSSRLAYMSSGRIRILDIQAGTETSLSPSNVNFAEYSPSDTHFAYTNPYLRRMTTGGSGSTLLSGNRSANPVWSHAGDRLAYSRWASGDPFPQYTGLYVIDQNGSNNRYLAQGYVHHPKWQPPRYRILGQVRSPNGSLLAGVEIRMSGGFTTKTGQYGEYTFENLKPGSYTLSAYKDGYTFGPKARTLDLASDIDRIDFLGTDRLPVVFVHGWNGFASPLSCEQVKPDDYFSTTDNLVQAMDYYVEYAFLNSAGCYTPEIEYNIGNLLNAINNAKNATGQSKVILVAHSMGGLVSRAYIEGSYYADDVEELFTFGSPHLGTTLRAFKFWWGFPYIDNLDEGDVKALCTTQPVVCQFTESGMKRFNEIHSKRKSVEYHLISGSASYWSRSVLGKLLYGIVPGEDDGIVPVNSGLGVDGVEETWQSDEVHTLAFGKFQYFVRNGGWSESYKKCLSPILEGTSTRCLPFEGVAKQTAQDAVEPDWSVQSPPIYVSAAPGQTITKSVPISGTAALFTALADFSIITFELETPNGTRITPAYASQNPNKVFFEEDTTIGLYHLFAPSPGLWQVRIQNRSSNTIAEVEINTSIEASVTFSIALDADSYQPGGTALVTATILPAPGNTSVEVKVIDSQSKQTSAALGQMSPGIYAGPVTLPETPGYADVRVTAIGFASEGTAFNYAVATELQLASSAFTLTGIYAEQKIPSYYSYRYEDLWITVGITTPVISAATVSGVLVDPQGRFVAAANAPQYIYPNDPTGFLWFRGEDIVRSQLDGPYTLQRVTIEDLDSNGVLAAEAVDAYTTQPHKYTDFERKLLYLPIAANQSTNAQSRESIDSPTVSYPFVPLWTRTAVPNQ